MLKLEKLEKKIKVFKKNLICLCMCIYSDVRDFGVPIDGFESLLAQIDGFKGGFENSQIYIMSRFSKFYVLDLAC